MTHPGPEWKTSEKPVAYAEALAFMDERVAGIHAGSKPECVWLLEHPPLYTGGTSAKAVDLLNPKFPVHPTGRGGEYTYHGPGQRVAYAMLDLKTRQKTPDLKKYVCDVQDWVIASLAAFDVQGVCREGRIGIWVNTPGGEKKIAAIGVRVRHWITLHGVSINVNPDLSHYDGIVPCGISEYGVTSLSDLGIKATMSDLDAELKKNFLKIF
jgi:lipoyl(octanoyl) transferase